MTYACVKENCLHESRQVALQCARKRVEELEGELLRVKGARDKLESQVKELEETEETLKATVRDRNAKIIELCTELDGFKALNLTLADTNKQEEVPATEQVEEVDTNKQEEVPATEQVEEVDTNKQEVVVEGVDKKE